MVSRSRSRLVRTAWPDSKLGPNSMLGHLVRTSDLDITCPIATLSECHLSGHLVRTICSNTLSGRLVLTPCLDTMLGHYIGRHMFKVTFIQTYLSDSWTCPDIMFRHHIRVVPGLHILSSCHGILSGIMSDNRILVIIYTPLGNGVLSRHHLHYGVPSGQHSGT